MTPVGKDSPIILIAVAVIGCLGVVVASAIGIIPDLLDRIPTPQPSPTSQIIPTETIVVFATSTLIPTIKTSPTAIITSKEVCIHPTDLADQKGWLNPVLSDSIYGGFKVSLLIDSTLPALWEANKYNNLNLEVLEKQIFERSINRGMEAGVWVIYMPYECRSEFGFYK